MKLRRSLLLFAALLPLGSAALAQAYPARPITIVLGSTAGSATDGLARAIAAEVTKSSGQPVIVDNRAGAFGGIAAQYTANAQPDGYTLFMTTNTTQSANPHLLKKLSYDPIKDFAPVALLARGYLALVVNPKVKANNVAELVALAKSAPGKLNYGSGSSSAQVATELFQQSTGTKFTYVPYKANPPAVLDLVGGQIDLMIVDLTTSLPQVKAGKLRALGISSAKPSPLVPEVPTIATSLPGYEFGYWNALYAPAKTPAPVVQRLSELMRDALATPSVRQAIEKTGQEVAFAPPEELAKFQLAELDRWGRIIKAAGIEPE
ncbi:MULTISPECIES: tripartite tricarboxylate transporter substrate binding protein [unclassified Variovorax]|uniref:Bug family tripartite tricarboxylate transporter substrate binding protein n=1 Tax=unclassified Variovorax TaxID=663243 RepID=UPI002575A7E6|nr:MULTISPECIES: tripartite tricarboxylate transporter substrate binding protein [unclassified Variovorax]MDM0088772.1 tripartite tricarboxylate transporter substrate binding protein [Variovorax sp. J22G40]MDM0146845.1 tripartite tricarboxylate transporter substrate binding protein [Variovorax sp. J2P1-31]